MSEKHNTLPVTKSEILFLSFFGLGFAKKAPGTMGSIGAVPILIFLGYFKVPLLFVTPLFLFAFVGSCYLTQMVQKKYQVQDPSWIVIDEVLGMIVSWAICPIYSPLSIVLHFLFFRLFDITKIWPVSFVDKKIKNGFGVIFDDIVAGIYSGLCVYLVHKFII